MVKNPYNITLSSTKRNIAMIFFTIAIIGIGIFLMNSHGFNANQISGNYDGNASRGIVYAVNLIFALSGIVLSIFIMLIRRDILGIICGFVLLIFFFFFMSIGYINNNSSNDDNHEYQDLTMFTMLTEK